MLTGLIVGLLPFVSFGVLCHFVDNLYVLMFFYAMASITTADYYAKFLGNDGFRIAGLFIFPLLAGEIATFSVAYKLFLFGQLALWLNKPKWEEVVYASALRRRYGIIFGLIGGVCSVVGLCWGVYNLVTD